MPKARKTTSEQWRSEISNSDVDLLDWPFRYLVRSKSNKGYYLVDFEEQEGRGRCTCAHFQCIIEPARSEGKDPAACKHMIAAKLFVADIVLSKLLS